MTDFECFTIRRGMVPAAEELLGKYFPVLDHGFVALVDYMGGDLAVERAARTSYHLGEEVRPIARTRDLIRYLTRHRHTSPFEMTELVFHVGLPIFVMRQLVRHRTASLNEYSGRYSEMPLLFYMPEPDQVCTQAKSNKQGRAEPVAPGEYERFRTGLSDVRSDAGDAYRLALGAGIARETARIDLPLSMYTYAYFKMDLRNLLHLIGLRSDPHAQWEIRRYSDVMAGLVRAVAPLCFEAFLDYQFEGATFSRMELDALRLLPEGLSPAEAMDAVGLTNPRERDEFLARLGPREQPLMGRFDLDLDSVVPQSHFTDRIREAV